MITKESKVKLTDLDSLCRALEQSFDAAEFRDLCSQVNVDYDDLLGDERASRMRELVFYLQRRSRLAALIVCLCENRPNIKWEAMVAEVEEPVGTIAQSSIPFINRENERLYIQAGITGAYFILDAPAGFGKTALMQQLHRHFCDEGWLSAYIAIDANSTLSDLVKALADELHITSLLAQDKDGRPWGMRFGTALQNHWDLLDKNGLVLLIDLDERTPADIVEALITEFIPNVYDCMRVLRFFERKQNRFRIVLAGRSLTPPPQTYMPIPLAIMPLKPFKFNTVLEMARSYLPQLAEGVLNQLGSHVYYLTGGHPGCMTKTLEMFRQRGGTPDFFVQHYGDMLWRDVIRPTIEELHEDIGEKSTVLSDLSILRYHNYEVLEQIFPRLNTVKLADDLTTSYLLDRNGRFLVDNMTRRLLAIQRRYENPEAFQTQCQKAQTICKNKLKKNQVQSPETWTVEYLFQYLQQFTDIQDTVRRQQIREEFFNVQAPEAIRLFIAANKDGHHREEYEALKKQIDGDWEFQFTVNYYLRDVHYSHDAFIRLQAQIKTYFDIKKERESTSQEGGGRS